MCVAATGCGLGHTAGNVAAFTGGLPTGVVTGKERGNAVWSVGGAAFAGTRELAETRDRGIGAGVQSSGVGIASDDNLSVALHSRLMLGVGPDDYVMGEIDIEVGPGYLHRGNIGGGVTAGWNYSGLFDGAHSLPVRAIGYWSMGAIVAHASAHVSFTLDDDVGNNHGGDVGVVNDRIPLAIDLRYEKQAGADVVGVAVGWAMRTVGKKR